MIIIRQGATNTHVIQDDSTAEKTGEVVKVKEDTAVTHAEHRPVNLEKGKQYSLGTVLEYDPIEDRTSEVVD